MLKLLSSIDVPAEQKGFSFEGFISMDPDVYRLSACVATWPYVPFTVLRRCRQFLSAGMPTFIEAAVCTSPISDAYGGDGFSLTRVFRHVALSHLRSAVRGAPSVRAEVEQLRSFHTKLYYMLSPLLVVETDLAWDYVLLEPEHLKAKTDERLRDVLLTGVTEKRDGMFTWAAGARARLPAVCMEGEAAWLLSQFCHQRQIEMAPVPTPPDSPNDALMSLMSAKLPTVVVGVFRTPDGIELGPPSPRRSVGIQVIYTEPMVISVQERSASGRMGAPRRVLLQRGKTVQVRCGRGQIVLRNLTGQTFTLARLEGQRSVEAAAAVRVIQRALDAMQRKDILDATVVRFVDSGYVVTLDEIDGTAFMKAPVEELMANERIRVRIDFVNQDTRWVLVSLVSRQAAENLPWESVRILPTYALPNGLRDGDVFPALLFKYGKDRGRGFRSAHVQFAARTMLGDISLDNHPGFLRFPAAVRLRGEEWYPPEGSRLQVIAESRDRKWVLRLRADPGAPAPAQTERLRSGKIVEATVVALLSDGADLEAEGGQLLWLPRLDMRPLPRDNAPQVLQLGDLIIVRVLGISMSRPSRYHVSQRALAEPYLLHLRGGQQVVGAVYSRSSQGEWYLMLDPIPGVSSHPFVVRTSGCANTAFGIGARVSATVSRLVRTSWLLLVKDTRLV